MKVAYLFGSLTCGGTEILLLDVFKNAANASFEFIGIHRKGGVLQSDFYETGQKFFRLSPKFMLDVSYFFKLRKLLKREKINIIHTQMSLDALYAWIACLGTGIKIVQTSHSFDNLNPNKKNKLFSFTAHRIDKNIFVSRYQKDYYIKKYKLQENRQAVLYNGISFAKFDTTNAVPDFLQKSPSAKLKIAMVGSFMRGRSQNVVCKFLKLLRDKNIEFDFYFVGKKVEKEIWRYAECVSYCKENNLEDCVHFVGSRDDVPAILKNIDAFVYSTDHDTFGIAIVEAIAAGVPVFVNDWGVMKEITKNGEWATLYKTKDEQDLLSKFMLFLHNRDEFRSKALENSCKIKKAYSIENHIANMNKIYLSLYE